MGIVEIRKLLIDYLKFTLVCSEGCIYLVSKDELYNIYVYNEGNSLSTSFTIMILSTKYKFKNTLKDNGFRSFKESIEIPCYWKSESIIHRVKLSINQLDQTIKVYRKNNRGIYFNISPTNFKF